MTPGQEEQRAGVAIPFRTHEAVLPEKHLRFRADLAERIRRHDLIWGAPDGLPASWKEGAPIGNGDFGALIYGSPDSLTFSLAKTDLWDRSGEARSNFKGAAFDDVRRCYLDNDRAAFGRLCDQPPVRHFQHATTAGRLVLRFHEGATAAAPSLRLALHEGAATLAFTPVGVISRSRVPGLTRIQSIVSRDFQVLAVRAEPSADCPGFRADPSLRRALVPEPAPLGTIAFAISRPPHEPHPALETGMREGCLWLRQRFTTGDHYAMAFAPDVPPTTTYPSPQRIASEISVPGTGGTSFFLSIVSHRDAADPLEEALRRVRRARTAGYAAVMSAHQAWWREYWKRAYVCVEDAALEKWWYVSLYQCACMIEPGRQSPGLQGVWVHENVPAWNGDYHTNVNLQAVYWGLCSANRVAFMEPYVRLLHSLAVQARRDTEQYFRMRGLRFPHAASIDGFELTSGDWATHLGVSVGGSSWLTQLLWQIYTCTGDLVFLRESAWPLLRDVARFYEDYLQRDPVTGRLTLEPSLFFEALCPRFEAWGRNSLYELTLVYGAFIRAGDAARALGEADEARHWDECLRSLPDFPTEASGEVWIGFEGRDLREHGSHQFALPPVFPGELVSLWHGPDHWRAQALATLDDPLTGKGMTGKAWCGGQGIREIVRMGREKEAAAAARWTAQDNTNGLVHNWASHYLQADHGPGMCSVLSDMLALSPGGVVRLFPCFPADVPAAFHSLRLPGAWLVSAEKRGAVVDYAVLQSLAGNELMVANPWEGLARLRDAETRVELTVSRNKVLTTETQVGQILILDRPDHPYESIGLRTSGG